mmetsp:Transcript_92253/g.112965  ORF Transcript_92253/g.112965 Transcript_92253/m.112965 type:complete len:155 (-) Transcript_92253:156-620(-)
MAQKSVSSNNSDTKKRTRPMTLTEWVYENQDPSPGWSVNDEPIPLKYRNRKSKFWENYYKKMNEPEPSNEPVLEDIWEIDMNVGWLSIESVGSLDKLPVYTEDDFVIDLRKDMKKMSIKTYDFEQNREPNDTDEVMDQLFCIDGMNYSYYIQGC